MSVHERWGRGLAGLLLVGTLAACSSDEPGPAPDVADDEAMTSATVAASAAAAADGVKSLGAVGESGDLSGAELSGGPSTTLPWAGTIRAFAVCTGGGTLALDLAGTPLDLDCDGAVQVVDPLVLPDRAPEFSRTGVSGSPESWGVAFAERGSDDGPPGP